MDHINKLSEFINRRFPEPTLKMSKKEFKRRSIERYISTSALIKLCDGITTDPSDELFDMLYHYNGLLLEVSDGNYAQKNVYNMYIRVLTIMKDFIEKESNL